MKNLDHLFEELCWFRIISNLCLLIDGVSVWLLQNAESEMYFFQKTDINDLKFLLQLERVNLSAAQTLRAAFIKVRHS